MSENPAGNELLQIGAAVEPVDSAPRELPRMRVPHAGKFRFALGALAGIAAVAVAVAVVVAARSSGPSKLASGGSWSSWAPTSSGSEGVLEIAQHIAPFYRLSAAQQLDVVTPISVSQATAAGTTTGSGLTVAVNTSSSGKAPSLALLSGKTVAYNVCGLGAKGCELAGTPSVSRMLLLRREALELALYTFRYISGSQNVVAVLPPGHTVQSNGSSSSSGSGKPVTVAVAFVRNELQQFVDAPLSHTLQQYPPEVPQLHIWSQTGEAGLVDQITAHALFSSQVESQQVGGRLLVLSQLPPQ